MTGAGTASLPRVLRGEKPLGRVWDSVPTFIALIQLDCYISYRIVGKASIDPFGSLVVLRTAERDFLRKPSFCPK